MTTSDWIGKTLSGRFEIVELLGEGGMSAVYKANDPNLRRVVAIKLIHSHLSKQAEFVHRFEEEAAAVAQLRHPNLIQVFDFSSDGDTFYIVFEFIPGESEYERLNRMHVAGMKMDVDETTDVIAKVADGLHYAHKRGLIHRDIKPANIMLNVQGEPIVMDFGIAKIMGGAQHTASGAVLGTARYMSPEQIKGELIDPRTDIYSLGVTLFEMLGDRPPFEADSAMTLMMMHMSDPVPDLSKYRPEVPLGLIAVVNKAMAKDPEDRFQTADEMAAALRAIDITGESVSAAGLAAAASVKPQVKTTADDATTALPVPAASAREPQAEKTETLTPTPTAPADEKSSTGRAGMAIVLLLAGFLAIAVLAVGAWAIFIRDSGDDQEINPTVVAVAEDGPDIAATEQADEQMVFDQLTEEANAVALTVEADESALFEQLTQEAESVSQTVEALVAQTAEAEPTYIPTSTPAPEPEYIGPSAGIDLVFGDVIAIDPDGQENPVDENLILTENLQLTTGADSEVIIILPDESIVHVAENSTLSIEELAQDPADTEDATTIRLLTGDVLLRGQADGNVLVVISELDNTLATLESPLVDGALSVSIDGNRVVVSCYEGDCTSRDGQVLNESSQIVIAVDGAYISAFPITSTTRSYLLWQELCQDCLPEAPTIPPTPTPTQSPLLAPSTG